MTLKIYLYPLNIKKPTQRESLMFSSELKMFLKIERHFWSWKCFYCFWIIL